MQEQLYVYFNSPPSPYYLEHGLSEFKVGDSHPNRHRLNLFDLIIVREGNLHLGEEHMNWSLRAGEALLLLPDRYHYSVTPVTTETNFYWIHFQTVSQWIQTDEIHYKFPTEAHQDCVNPTPYTMQINKMTTLAYPQQVYDLVEKMSASSQLLEPKAYWQKQQTFEQLLQMLDIKQQSTGTNSMLRLAEQVEHYLRNQYRNPISNQLLSEVFNYHYNYITRAMKKVYGYSPNEYVTKLRLDQAKLLLLNTHDTVAEIASAVGFENIPYFANCFQKHIGESPSKFRNKYARLANPNQP